MPIIARGIDDLILDEIVTALENFSIEQSLIDANVGFFVKRDLTRPPSMAEMPLVVVWLERDENIQGTKTSQSFRAVINVDCYTKGVEADEDFEDGVAMQRLYYLKEQVKYGLYKLVNADFNQSAGIIGRKKWPSWTLFQSDLKLPESEVVAGRWTLDLELAWIPQDINTVPLERVAVDTTKWRAYYDYSQGD